MTLACGLDFGTSNSTLGRVGADGIPHLLALEDGKQTIPSVLFFGFEDDAIHFGREAVAEYRRIVDESTSAVGLHAALYAITLGEPRGQVAIASLGRASGNAPRGIRSARLLGVSKSLAFQQTDAALVVDIPETLPTRHASVIKLALA